MITNNLSTLQIHKLSEEQYQRELLAGRIDPNALYLTPAQGGGGGEEPTGGVTDEVLAQAILTHNASDAAHPDIREALDDKANLSEGAIFVEGSGATDATAKTSTWVGTSDRITSYYDGLTIRYKIGVAGQSTVTLNINGLGAKTVYRYGETKLTTQFPVNSIIHLIYHADLNGGCWVCSDYDSNTNTYQRVYESSNNTEYAITTRYNTTDGSTYYAEYGRYTNGVTLNPSTNTITAAKFKGALVGNADTATKATQDGNGKNIASTYATKTEVETAIGDVPNEIYVGNDAQMPTDATIQIILDGEDEAVASYVQEEAERVAREVYSKQNANTFSFLAISDMHYNPTNSKIVTSNIHAGQGMDLVRENVHIDFAVLLGDNAWGSAVEGDANRATIERGIAEIRGANKCIDAAFRGIPNFRTPGNHDNLGENYTWNGNDWLDGNEIFPLYGAYNRGAKYPTEKDRGYCYRDIEDYKLRVICMNTSDLKDRDMSTGLSVYMSGTQMKWFAETLDMSEKSDAAEWSIIIFSHTPLDYSTSNQTVNILEAYINGTSVSLYKDGLTISYDYAGKNAAAIIGNVHGHNHCFLVDDLRKHIGNGVTTPIDVKRICVPNACFNRSNERGQNNQVDMYDIEYGETTTYNKTAGTAQDTAFNVITVDPVARKIYATNYGAGYDREISYGAPTPSEPTSPYTNVLKTAYTPPTENYITPIDTSALDDVGYRNGARLSGWTLSPNADYVATGVIKWRDAPGAFSGLKPIYIKGATLDTSKSYVRANLIQLHQETSLYLSGYIQDATTWASTFTIETLGEQYYKLTPLESGSAGWYNTCFIQFSLYGKGDNLIITIDEPIEGGPEPEKPAYTNLADGNYQDGKYISDNGSYGTDTATVATGYIKQTRNNPIYIKGCSLDDTSHVRLYVDSDQWGTSGAFVLWYCSGNATLDSNKFSTWYTVEELGDKYYKLTPKKEAIDARCELTGYTNNYYWYRISVKGAGADLIITDGEPIE